MRGAINNRMAEGIAGSSVILCFLTQNYIIKASGLGPRGEDDNCFFEFDNALIERGRSRLLPVVMEPRCCEPAKWTAGPVHCTCTAHDRRPFVAGSQASSKASSARSCT